VTPTTNPSPPPELVTGTTRVARRDGGGGHLPPTGVAATPLSVGLAATGQGGWRHTPASVLRMEGGNRLLGAACGAAASPPWSGANPRSWWPRMGRQGSRKIDPPCSGASSACRGVGGAPSVERRPSLPRDGPHGGGYEVLKVGGVVHPWGCSAVRSPRQRGGAVSSMVVLGARPLSWRWIGASFEACRSSTTLAVCLGGAAGAGRCGGRRSR
jgi:hypothetical protein